MADVTVAMVTSGSRLFEPDEVVRGKVFVFTGSWWGVRLGGGGGVGETVEKEKLGVQRTEVARRVTVQNG